MNTRMVVKCAMGMITTDQLAAETGRTRNACHQQVMRIRRKINELEEYLKKMDKPFHIPVCYDAALQYVMISRYDSDKYGALADAIEVQERYERDLAKSIIDHLGLPPDYEDDFDGIED